ncbi:unnamed protein product [Thlaspi arvense]|uniref:Uncharacterized protein n=1 Tax=Thlaspi arvense TaxID=13288 RepID=A0AAU9S2Z1_THLAR|nr:unnamed protein product [Thlaspi arvense]
MIAFAEVEVIGHESSQSGWCDFKLPGESKKPRASDDLIETGEASYALQYIFKLLPVESTNPPGVECKLLIAKNFLLAGVLSKFGAGLFLLVQVIILLDATHSWNDAWVAKMNRNGWYIALLAISVVCYIAAFAIPGVLFIWFNPGGHDCGLNVFFLVMTMILAFSFAVIALHPQVNGSLLPASVVSVYCGYVCYTALSCEPRDYVCNGLHNKSTAVSTSTLILGMLTTVLSVLYSALRAGSSTTFLSPPSSPKSGI